MFVMHCLLFFVLNRIYYKKLNNVNLVDKIENTSERNQGILVKKLDKIAKGRGI